MARYRIVQKPRPSDPTQPVYEVQRREWFGFWEYEDLFCEIDQAERFIQQCQERDAQVVVKTKVVKEYD